MALPRAQELFWRCIVNNGLNKYEGRADQSRVKQIKFDLAQSGAAGRWKFNVKAKQLRHDPGHQYISPNNASRLRNCYDSVHILRQDRQGRARGNYRMP